jgi:hypothetical protein
LLISQAIQWQIWRPSNKTGSKVILSGGKGACLCAYLPTGSTWKATTVFVGSAVCDTFTVLSCLRLFSGHIVGQYALFWVHLIIPGAGINVKLTSPQAPCMYVCVCVYIYTEAVPRGMCQIPGGCSLC